MKVLIAFGKDTYPNPFVRTLADGINRQGVDIVCSISEFWDNWQSYDIIHLQWPQILCKGLESIKVLAEHLITIRMAGIPIVTTCHNFRPHYSNNTMADDAYDVVYNNTDCFIHLGSYSYEEFKKKYTQKIHVIIPHHIYDEQYKFMPSKEEAIKHLNLKPSKRYILCFGAFRSQEERDLVNFVAKAMAPKRIAILAPGFSRFTFRKNVWKSMKAYYQYAINKIKYDKIIFSSQYVPDEELPFYYAASDIALIQRKQILNSGNLPMAYMMGMVVVGPDVGNVGAILRETNNPTFKVDNLSTLIDATNEAFYLKDKGKGEDNKQFAYKHYSTEIVAKLHCKLYNKLLSFGHSYYKE